MTCTNGADKKFLIQLSDVQIAAERIKEHIKYTPCDRSSALSEVLGMEVYLKKEFLQETYSYKERGAVNTLMLLDDEKKRKGVIAASAGNHALALSFHGKRFNIPVSVVMPLTSSSLKADLCTKYGANVIKYGDQFSDAYSHGMCLAGTYGYEYINGYDDPRIIAGQGTVGLEILKQVDNIDAIVVPVGGGGLIAGILTCVKHLKSSIKIIGVQTNYCHCVVSSLESGHPVRTDADFSLTIADGLAVQTAGKNAYTIIKGLVDEVIQIDEAFIPPAILHLVEGEKCVVEGAAAAGVAAVLSGKLDYLKSKRVVFVLTGGNINIFTLLKTLEIGLIKQNKIFSFGVILKKNTSALMELLGIISKHETSIKEIRTEVTTFSESMKMEKVFCTIECQNSSTCTCLKKELRNRYKEFLYFPS